MDHPGYSVREPVLRLRVPPVRIGIVLACDVLPSDEPGSSELRTGCCSSLFLNGPVISGLVASLTNPPGDRIGVVGDRGPASPPAPRVPRSSGWPGPTGIGIPAGCRSGTGAIPMVVDPPSSSTATNVRRSPGPARRGPARAAQWLLFFGRVRVWWAMPAAPRLRVRHSWLPAVTATAWAAGT
jgi:hypothetical protein